jgi:CcmD family protein
MKNRKNLLLSLLLLIAAPAITLAQPTDGRPEMADAMRANGMIYVVVAVLLTILLGLLFYVYRLDRKVTKLEKAAN